jgi:soluble lytic murein transglycosylase
MTGLILLGHDAFAKPSQLKPENEEQQEIRLEHAKELLGKYYKRSVVKHGANANSVALVRNWVNKSLPQGKYRKMAKRITRAILAQASKYELDPVFIMAIIQSESSFDPDTRGDAGEIGLMQILPATGEWMAKKTGIAWKGPRSLANPVTNIRIGAAYVNYLRERFDNHGRLYLAAYNMGPKNVNRALAKSIWPKDYPIRVMNNYVDFYAMLSGRTPRKPASIATPIAASHPTAQAGSPGQPQGNAPAPKALF